jgi:cobalamin biosynthesis Mg chelatase CobN
MINDKIKQYVKDGDVKNLKYYFKDCLNVDPTFAKYEEAYEYCKSEGIPFVPHIELTPMNLDSVDEEYWAQLRRDFMENPSVERMDHMREVAKILYRDRIEKIAAENTVTQPNPPVEDTQPVTPKQPTEPVKPKQPTPPTTPQVPKSDAQTHSTASTPKHTTNTGSNAKTTPIRGIPSSGSASSTSNTSANSGGVRRVSEPVKSSKSTSQNTPNSEDTQSKKADGVNVSAVLVVAVLVVVLLIILFHK